MFHLMLMLSSSIEFTLLTLCWTPQQTAAPYDPSAFFAVVIKLESITVTEGIATILAWNSTLRNYTLQLYYTTNGVDQTYSDALTVAPGANLTIFESYDYDQEAWTVGANVTQTGQSLFLSFGEDLTLSEASIELATLLPGVCSQLPASNDLVVYDVGYNCGFIGCGPWVPNTWEACDVVVNAHGPIAGFTFNSTLSSTTSSPILDKRSQLSSVSKDVNSDEIVVMKEDKQKKKRRVKRN